MQVLTRALETSNTDAALLWLSAGSRLPGFLKGIDLQGNPRCMSALFFGLWDFMCSALWVVGVHVLSMTRFILFLFDRAVQQSDRSGRRQKGRNGP